MSTDDSRALVSSSLVWLSLPLDLCEAVSAAVETHVEAMSGFNDGTSDGMGSCPGGKGMCMLYMGLCIGCSPLGRGAEADHPASFADDGKADPIVNDSPQVRSLTLSPPNEEHTFIGWALSHSIELNPEVNIAEPSQHYRLVR